MKTINLLLILLAISSYSCGIRKDIIRDRNSARSEAITRVQSEIDRSRSAMSASWTQRSDSSLNRYILTIFPLDTFRFSPSTGFSGKASRVEIISEAVRISEGMKINHRESATHEKAAVSSRSSNRQAATSKTKQLNVQKSSPWLILTALSLLLVGLYYRYKKYWL